MTEEKSRTETIEIYGIMSEDLRRKASRATAEVRTKIDDDVKAFYLWHSVMPKIELVEAWANHNGEPVNLVCVGKPSIRRLIGRVGLHKVPRENFQQPHYRVRCWDSMVLIEKYQEKEGEMTIFPVFKGEAGSFPEDMFLINAVKAAQKALMALKSTGRTDPFFPSA